VATIPTRATLAAKTDQTGRMNAPNLFIAGTTKGGTSSLQMWLNQHPQISLTEPKELHFFCNCPNPDLRAATDLDDYLGRFSDSPVTGEASPCYLYERATAEAIADHFPTALIVISLRDPVERFWSHYLMNEVYRPTGLGPEAILRQCLERGRSNALDDLFGMGLYGQQVSNYIDVFGLEQLEVTFLESLASRPDHELSSVLEFLGVEAVSLDTSGRDKEYVVPRGPLGRLLLHNPRVRNVGVRLLAAPVRRFLRTRILGDPSRKPRIPRDLQRSLRELYRVDCNLLEDILGRPLPWDWHRVDQTTGS
jgi:hypothetical protein